MYGTLISTQTLATTAASVTFSSIPATYTDLVLVFDGRRGEANTVACITFNNDTASNYVYRELFGNGSAASSITGSPAAFIFTTMSGSGDTASTFGSTIVTIPNYAGSATKVVSVDTVRETNATANSMALVAGSWTTASINRIDITANGGTFAAGSTFSLYGLTHF